MSITFNLNNTTQRALDAAILGCVREAVEFLAEKHGFDCEESLAEMNLVKPVITKKPAKAKVLKPTIPLPFCGTLLTSCCGIRVNHGLHSQCSNAKESSETSGEALDYCKTCNKQAMSNESGAPNGGDIRARISGEWSPVKGKLVSYGNVMEKLNITREKAETEAAKLGLTIPEEQFEVVKGRRGRPKSDTSISSSDDEKPKKPRGRPKKDKKVLNSSTGDDLIPQLVAAASADTTESCSSSESDASPSTTKIDRSAAREEAKAAKLAEREAAKASKLAEREAAKAAKLAERETAKAAKLAERETAKAAKLAEKKANEESKAAKLAEKKANEESKAEKKAKKPATPSNPEMFLANLGTPSSPKCEIHDISLKSNVDELTEVENSALNSGVIDSDIELEAEDSDSGSDEEESIDAIIKEIKGKKYVMARDTKHLYDAESHEPLNQYYDEEADEIKNLPDDEE